MIKFSVKAVMSRT